MKQRLKLMIPGPVEVSPEVLEPMARPMTPHYESEWAAFHAETIALARMVFRTQEDLFIAVGSGSAGLEACLSGLVGSGAPILIPINGVFGKLLATIANSYGGSVVSVELPTDRPILANDLDHLLSEHPDVRSVAVVHVETHSGLLNPVESYGTICRRHGALLMVDAISSLAGARLEMDAWGVDLCVTASQKAIGAPPGLCLVAVGPRAWPVIAETGGPGWYLNLNAWRQRAREWVDWHPTLTTMAVNTFRALRVALDLAVEEGMERRWARHRAASQIIRQAAGAMGLEPLISAEHAAPTVTTLLLPDGLRATDMRSFVADVHGIMIAGAHVGPAERAVRVGHMGPGATPENAVLVCLAMEDFLRRNGRGDRVGRCLERVDPSLLVEGARKGQVETEEPRVVPTRTPDKSQQREKEAR